MSPPEAPATGPAGAHERPPGGLAAWLARWRLALRLARRDARRAPGRTVLVLLMVGLPVMAIVAGDTLFRTNELSAGEALPYRLGSADARIIGLARGPVYADPVAGEAVQMPAVADPPWTADEVRSALPAGSRVVEVRVGRIVYRTGVGYANVDGLADDVDRPIRDGAYTVVAGRAPSRDDEVAISPAIARRGVGVGDTLEITRDDLPATVVGVLRSDVMGGTPFVVVPLGAAELLTSRSSEYFADVPGGLGWPAVQQLNELGLAVVSREVAQDPPPAVEYLPPGISADGGLTAQQLAVLGLVVAALLLEVVLLAGPAFAVGLRRQRRDLALLAANGGTPADLRRAVLASGLVLGAGAAVLGALLGVALARAAVPVLEDRWDVSFGPFDVPLLDVLVVVAVGGLAGLAAAYVPARQAARTDVVTTLTGRRGQVRTSWRLPVVGLVVAAAGLVLTVLGARGTELGVAGGAVLLIVGVVVATPWLVGLLAPLARRLPTAGRLAVRDATRNRGRTAPAVAAVMATVAGVTALAVGSASDSAQSERDYVPWAPLGTARIGLFEADQEGWAAVQRAVAEQLPDHDVVAVQGPLWNGPTAESLWLTDPRCEGPAAACSWFPEGASSYTTTLGEVVVVDGETVAALVEPALRDEVLATLAAGRVAVFGRGALDASGQVTLQASRFDGTTDQPLGSVTLPATEIPVPTATGLVQLPAIAAVPPVLADRLPVEIGTTQLMVGGAGAPVTPEEERRLSEAITALTAESGVYVERGWTDDLWVARLLLLVVGGTLVLVATLTATGLAVADARPDLATLAAIGAAPRTRRLMAMGSAAVIGVTGAVLGVLAGLAPGVAVAYPLTSTDYGSGGQPLVVIPWGLLAAVAVGVPLLAVVVTGLAVRSRLPMVRRVAG